MDWDADEVRDYLEDRWKAYGFELLLPEEQRYIVLWWLRAEVWNGTLDQYFWNGAGDSAPEAVIGLREIGAIQASNALQRAIAVFDVAGGYSKDYEVRRDRIARIPNRIDLFTELTTALCEYTDIKDDFVDLALGLAWEEYQKRNLSPDTDRKVQRLRKPWWRLW